MAFHCVLTYGILQITLLEYYMESLLCAVSDWILLYYKLFKENNVILNKHLLSLSHKKRLITT